MKQELISINEFAKRAGRNRSNIYYHIDHGNIKPDILNLPHGGKLYFIDLNVYDPANFSEDLRKA